jgi:aldehyde dehydrogenase (NAD+)
MDTRYGVRNETWVLMPRSAHTADLTKTMVEEYGGVVQFAGPIVQAGADVFLAAERALPGLPLTRSWDKTTVTMEPVGVAEPSRLAEV